MTGRAEVEARYWARCRSRALRETGNPCHPSVVRAESWLRFWRAVLVGGEQTREAA